ncbi:amidase [Marinivivus vitaminiproducens]|uniref:amidase n=1 Tax=Marinivivus vitaminiproducens TaxID=3035935 RepID=UPI0027A9FE27|nr:amidase [Geminicoccaceae bacterium SCSIO 64248]
MSEPIPFRSASELAGMIRERAIGAQDLLELHLERVDRLNPELNAIVVQDREAARRRAREADEALAQGRVWGPLHGVPITVKESFDVAGLPSTWGEPAFRDNRPERDSVAVQRLREAGAVLFGKTNVPLMLADWQTYNAIYGTTHNPWARGRTPGGSSGGSAAALASGMTAFEIGSDIGASIRNPAHFCGVFGHKPSWGIVPYTGHLLPGLRDEPDLTVAGPLARSAADLTLGLDILAGAAGKAATAWRLELPPPRAARLENLRIAVMLESAVSEVDRAYRAVLEKLVGDLEAQGARIERARPGFDDWDHHQTYMNLLRAVTTARQPWATFERALEVRRNLADADRSYSAMVTRGTTLYHREWVAEHEKRLAFQAQWAAFFERYDVLLCPAAASAAFPQDEARPREERRIPVNGREVDYNDQLYWAGIATASLLPSTVAPAGLTADGLPTGVQIIGPHLEDRTPLAMARLIEAIRPFTPPPGLAA